jgi:cation diffusion facilitator CzcD-associated flavoprotein CzcO
VSEHFDMLIVGAGLSGVDAAYRLKTKCPGKSWCILEARGVIGGTWDLFRYPGIRSDSDMYTLGFPFRPWRGDKAIAEGPHIRSYIEETAREFGIDRNIRFRQRVVSASWSSAEQRWTLEVAADGENRRVTCAFLFLCSGYYRYDRGHSPSWPGEEDFRGAIVHPQLWPENLDYRDRKIVVIGSGATAVTLVPALAEKASHVTMLQRSPSYIVSRPSRDKLARRFGARFGRLKNAALGLVFFNLARRRPAKVRAKLLDLVRRDLPAGYDVERHFGPNYDPWDQRLCLVPDGDLFEAIRGGKVAMATGEIERFTQGGIRLKSGEEVAADMVVTATGLVMKLMGGIALSVDGEPVNVAERFVYKGMMLDGVPNLALSFGYINASWTLKCDLTALHACRLLNFMDRRGHGWCVPRLPDPPPGREPMLDFTSGYVRRAAGLLPAQGDKAPWRVHQNYFRDLLALRFGTLTDGVMEFGSASSPPALRRLHRSG